MNQEIFYISQNATHIARDAIAEKKSKIPANAHHTWKVIPEGDNILVFSSIISQNFGKGESSNNGYKYDQSGWVFDDYDLNPVILWQHNSSHGGIGHTVSLWLDEDKNLNSLFYVDLDTLEPRHAKQIKGGYTSGISTGASSLESMFEENDTGKRYTQEEAEEKFGWENVWRAIFGSNNILTLVITKAKLLENSIVTIGSNPKAIIQPNSIDDHFKKLADEYRNQKAPQNPLPTNSHSMSHTDKNTAETTTDTPSEGTPATAPENTDAVSIESLTNTIEQLKADHVLALDAVRAEEKAKYDALLQTETDKIRSEERKNLAKIVSEQNSKPSEVTDTDSFKKKYLPR